MANARVLVIDDEESPREAMRFILKDRYDVTLTESGANGLEALSKSEPFDVVLLDMIMPVCDGPSTIRAIRKNPTLRDLRVVAVSGNSPATWGITTGPDGVDAWFPKPLNPESLLADLQRKFCRRRG